MRNSDIPEGRIVSAGVVGVFFFEDLMNVGSYVDLLGARTRLCRVEEVRASRVRLVEPEI